MGKPLIDLAGMKFGRLSVKERAGYDGKTLWRCICDCGEERIVRSPHLRSGKQVSCGCLKAETARARMTKHGNAPRSGVSRTYSIWTNMVSRCTNPKNENWQHYGARGISVCDRWMTFDGFLADMGDAPANGTIDRINTDGGYCPENCRWTDWATQMRNKRNNVWVELNGEKMVREDAKAILGLSNRAMNKFVAEQKALIA
jgi:hypothetical protein